MGAIAAHGGDAALKLFRQVLLASASVEGMFPPVYITVEANGRQFQEMHADGGVQGPLFFGPEAYLMPGSPLKLPATELYVIVNGKLSSEFYMPSRTTAGILGRAIGLALKAGGRLQVALAGVAAWLITKAWQMPPVLDLSVAVVAVRNGTCEGCRMRVPPQLYNQIQRNEQVFLCPSCQRMLHWRPEQSQAS